jgi:hypothetical protein
MYVFIYNYVCMDKFVFCNFFFFFKPGLSQWCLPSISVVLISSHENSVDRLLSNSRLAASFRRFRQDNLRVIPFCSRFRRVLQHRPRAVGIEKSILKYNVIEQIMLCGYLLF